MPAVHRLSGWAPVQLVHGLKWRYLGVLGALGGQ